MATDSPMQLGMVGLGRMGANIVRRIMRDGHKAVVYDVSADAVSALEADGADGSTDLATFVQKMERPRNVWIMVPAGKITESVITQLADLLEPGDAIIDGGNSYYHDDIRHAANLKDKGIHFVDCGTSGGVWGLERGYCLMIGGDADAVRQVEPLFAALAPGIALHPTVTRPLPLADHAPATPLSASRLAPRLSRRVF